MKIDERFLSEISFSAVRSRGPGGQNVNKVSSAAILYWPFRDSFYLNEDQKSRIALKLSSHINKEGFVYLRSDESRDLEKNKKRCIEKLKELLDRAFFEPKKRKATKPTKSSQVKRRDDKKRLGDKKTLRGKVKY